MIVESNSIKFVNKNQILANLTNAFIILKKATPQGSSLFLFSQNIDLYNIFHDPIDCFY